MRLTVNGIERRVPDAWRDEVLLSTLREYFGLVGTKYSCGTGICGACKVLVDGRPVKDRKYPVGFMDVISLPEIKENFRVLMDKRGKWVLVRISPEEAKFKLSRIENKTTVKGGRTQLNL